jgi:glycosyltransferase involved in cell wall biosynthesis
MQVSVVIITYNEARNIGRCLASVAAVADEIVVLDSGSTDATRQICAEYGVCFEVQPFMGHIEQKNAALALAQHDWVLSLDADEALSETLAQSILEVKHQKRHENLAFSMNRLNFYGNQAIRHGGWYPDRKIRLWNRTQGNWGGRNPHDKVVLRAGSEVSHLAGDLLHYSYANTAEHWAKARRYAQISAQAKYDAGKRSTVLHVIFAPIWKFFQAYFFQLGLLDGSVGLKIAVISSYEKFLKYKYMLILRFNARNQSENNKTQLK